MPILTFNGSVTRNIFNNQTVGGTKNIDLNSMIDTPITWSGTVPPDLNGKTIRNIEGYSEFTIIYNYNIKITGKQRYDDSSYPTTTVALKTNTNTINKKYQPSSPGSLGTATYNVNDNFPGPSWPVSIQIHVYNDCYTGLPGCVSYDATGYTFNLTVNVQVNADCTQTNLNDQFCSDYCSQNPDVCLNSYIDYCFPTNIGTSQSCQNFVKNYIENINPLAEFDQGLNQYCSKWLTFNDLFTTGTTPASPGLDPDSVICACHMPQEQYDNYAASLFALFPGYENLGLNERCLVSQCASSPYKSVDTGSQCNLPDCINIASFNNNGSFSGSSVTIVQTGGDCANITGGSPPPNGGGGSGLSTWVIILIIIGAILLLLIVVFVLYLLFKPKSPEPALYTSIQST